MYARDVPPGTPCYHGTKADLAVGDLLGPGFGRNFVGRALKHINFSATLEAAIWGAELAKGEGRERIYIVEPTGEYEDDPNLTDQNFPATSPPPTAASFRCASSARSRSEERNHAGSMASTAAPATRPNNSPPCAPTSPA